MTEAQSGTGNGALCSALGSPVSLRARTRQQAKRNEDSVICPIIDILGIMREGSENISCSAKRVKLVN